MSALALLPVVLATARAWDASEWLASETKLDTAAVEPAHCWCKEFSSLLEDRISAANTEIQGLESSTEVQHYANQRLQYTANEHTEEAADHQDSLDQAGSLADREVGAGQDEVEQLSQQLRTLKTAKSSLESGTPAWGAIDQLESTLTEHVEEAKASKESSASKFADLRAAKEKMLRLSRAAAAAHKERLATGLATLARARAELTAYTARRDADQALNSAVQNLCQLVENDASEREKKRQEAMILSSEAKVEQAQQEASKAAAASIMLLSNSQAGLKHRHNTSSSSTLKRMIVALELQFSESCPTTVEHAEENKRLATEALDGAKKSTSDLMSLVEKSGGLQSALEKMLHGAMTNSLNAERKVSGGLKGAVNELYKQAQSQLQAVAPPFEAVRAKSKDCTMADNALVTKLLGSRADASEALVDAERCSDRNSFEQHRATRMLRMHKAAL